MNSAKEAQDTKLDDREYPFCIDYNMADFDDSSSSRDISSCSSIQDILEVQNSPSRFSTKTSLDSPSKADPVEFTESVMQTEGNIYPLSGPFYIGLNGPSFSDEKLLEACIGFMHLRAEFLDMLKLQHFSEKGVTKKGAHKNSRRSRAMNPKAAAPMARNSSFQKLPTQNELYRGCFSNIRESRIRGMNSSDSNSNLLNPCFNDEESRKSGVPVALHLSTQRDLYPTAPSTLVEGCLPSRSLAGKGSSTSHNGINEASRYEARSPIHYSKKKGTLTDNTAQHDNGATPGRPRMNRSDFACTLCQTRNTPQWRYLDYEPVCNACYMRARKLQRSSNNQNGSYSGMKSKISRMNKQKKESNSRMVNVVNGKAGPEACQSSSNRVETSRERNSEVMGKHNRVVEQGISGKLDNLFVRPQPMLEKMWDKEREGTEFVTGAETAPPTITLSQDTSSINDMGDIDERLKDASKQIMQRENEQNALAWSDDGAP